MTSKANRRRESSDEESAPVSAGEVATAKSPRRRKRAVMTQAEWDRVEAGVRRAERHPDPAQATLEIGAPAHR